MKNLVLHFLTNLKKDSDDRVEREFNQIIETIISNCSDNTVINRPSVIKWLKQFFPRKKILAKKILENLIYCSSSTLTGKVAEIYKIVLDKYNNTRKNDIAFVPIGGAGSGAQIIARKLKSLTEFPNDNVVDIFELTQNKRYKDFTVIVFIDDFSGTGSTIKDWWDNIEPLILPLNMQIDLSVIFLNYKAEEKLRPIFEKLDFIDFLDKDKNIFNDECGSFTEEEKSQIISLGTSVGIKKELTKGFGECGLLIAFQHGCPNNSIPLLWKKTAKWLNLFHRRN